MLSAFLDTMIESHLGLSNGVKPEVLQRVLTAVSTHTKQAITIDSIKNKYDALKRDYRLWQKFQNRSGCTYNPRNGAPLEPVEAVDQWFDANPDFQRLRNNKIPFPEKQAYLYANMFATGDNVELPPVEASTGSDDCHMVSSSLLAATEAITSHLKRRHEANGSPSQKRVKTSKPIITISDEMSTLNSYISWAVAEIERDY